MPRPFRPRPGAPRVPTRLVDPIVYGAALEPLGVLVLRWDFARLGSRRKSVETELLGVDVADAGMRRGINQAVGGHDPVNTAPPDPVIYIPMLLPEVDELNPGPREKQESVRSLAPVASMMEPVGLDIRNAVRGKHPHHFAHRDLAELFGYDEIHEVIDVRQSFTRKAVHRNLAVKSERADVRAWLLDVCRLGIETVNHIY